MNKAITQVIMILLLSNLAYAAIGISSPKPDLDLLPGQEGNFQFKIDATTHPNSIVCEITLDHNTPLQVALDKTSTTINSGNIGFINGTVIVPSEISPDKYSETFCVTCTNLGPESSQTIPKYCEIPINVNVAGEIEEKPAMPLYTSILVAIAIILVLIALIVYLKKKKENKL